MKIQSLVALLVLQSAKAVESVFVDFFVYLDPGFEGEKIERHFYETVGVQLADLAAIADSSKIVYHLMNTNFIQRFEDYNRDNREVQLFQLLRRALQRNKVVLVESMFTPIDWQTTHALDALMSQVTSSHFQNESLYKKELDFAFGFNEDGFVAWTPEVLANKGISMLFLPSDFLEKTEVGYKQFVWSSPSGLQKVIVQSVQKVQIEADLFVWGFVQGQTRFNETKCYNFDLADFDTETMSDHHVLECFDKFMELYVQAEPGRVPLFVGGPNVIGNLTATNEFLHQFARVAKAIGLRRYGKEIVVSFESAQTFLKKSDFLSEKMPSFIGELVSNEFVWKASDFPMIDQLQRSLWNKQHSIDRIFSRFVEKDIPFKEASLWFTPAVHARSHLSLLLRKEPSITYRSQRLLEAEQKQTQFYSQTATKAKKTTRNAVESDQNDELKRMIDQIEGIYLEFIQVLNPPISTGTESYYLMELEDHEFKKQKNFQRQGLPVFILIDPQSRTLVISQTLKEYKSDSTDFLRIIVKRLSFLSVEKAISSFFLVQVETGSRHGRTESNITCEQVVEDLVNLGIKLPEGVTIDSYCQGPSSFKPTKQEDFVLDCGNGVKVMLNQQGFVTELQSREGSLQLKQSIVLHPQIKTFNSSFIMKESLTRVEGPLQNCFISKFFGKVAEQLTEGVAETEHFIDEHLTTSFTVTQAVCVNFWGLKQGLIEQEFFLEFEQISSTAHFDVELKTQVASEIQFYSDDSINLILRQAGLDFGCVAGLVAITKDFALGMATSRALSCSSTDNSVTMRLFAKKANEDYASIKPSMKFNSVTVLYNSQPLVRIQQFYTQYILAKQQLVGFLSNSGNAQILRRGSYGQNMGLSVQTDFKVSLEKYLAPSSVILGSYFNAASFQVVYLVKNTWARTVYFVEEPILLQQNITFRENAYMQLVDEQGQTQHSEVEKDFVVTIRNKQATRFKQDKNQVFPYEEETIANNFQTFEGNAFKTSERNCELATAHINDKSNLICLEPFELAFISSPILISESERKKGTKFFENLNPIDKYTAPTLLKSLSLVHLQEPEPFEEEEHELKRIFVEEKTYDINTKDSYMPKVGDIAQISYTARVNSGGSLQGTVVLRENDRTFEVGSDQVASCVDEAVQRMKVGQMMRLNCFQKMFVGVLAAQTTLDVTVQLLKVTRNESECLPSFDRQFLRRLKAVQDAEARSSEFQVVSLNGDELSKDAARPELGETLTVHYRGTLEDGTEFDSTFRRSMPFTFKIGRNQVIPCWDEGFKKLRIGEKARLICPPEMAYGDAGAGNVIPPGATLTFEVEVLSFQAIPSTDDLQERRRSKRKPEREAEGDPMQHYCCNPLVGVLLVAAFLGWLFYLMKAVFYNKKTRPAVSKVKPAKVSE